MVNRRHFLQTLSASLVFSGPPADFPASGLPSAIGAPATLRLALVADAHLPGPDPDHPTASNLRTALQEISACRPPVDLIIFLGDLSAAGQPAALALGRELLTASSRPWLALPGENDLRAAPGRNWNDCFGQSCWEFSWQNYYFLGCDLEPAPSGGFNLASDRCRWLLARLLSLPPDIAVLIFSHAPLLRLYRPWGWWTEGCEALVQVLQKRPRTYLFHGHLHQALELRATGLSCHGVPALSWPYPDIRQGPPGVSLPSPQPGRHGCGWLLLTLTTGGDLFLSARVWRSSDSFSV